MRLTAKVPPIVPSLSTLVSMVTFEDSSSWIFEWDSAGWLGEWEADRLGVVACVQAGQGSSDQ